MDGNLGKALKAILANLCVEYASKGEATLTDWLPQIERAFRDAGWIEPQQPEGELVPNPRPDNLSEVELKFPDFDQGILIGAQDGFDKGSKAQRAHMIQQGWVKLPSEDELALWLCDHLSYTSRGLAQELLLRLPKE